MPRMGYPKCTKEAIAQAVACKRNGMSNRDIAAYIGIAESTFYRWVNTPSSKNQSELGEALKNAEAEFKAALRNNLMRAREWQASAWLLERTFPDEYARPEARFAREAEGGAADAPTFVFEPDG